MKREYLNLRSENPLIRVLALRDLLNAFNSSENVSKLEVDVLELTKEIFDTIHEFELPLQNQLAWLIGFALNTLGAVESDLKTLVESKMLSILNLLQDSIAKHADADLEKWSGFFYMLGQFPQAASSINACLSDSFGQARYQDTALYLSFVLQGEHPERSHFLLNYLGASACDQIDDARAHIASAILACPKCLHPLAYNEIDIQCQGCQAQYSWHGHIPSLVPEGCREPQEYPKSLVQIYESLSRPRFVRVMGQDWHHLLTVQREAEYLARWMSPVDGGILDLACGVGNSTDLLVERFGPSRIIALDYSEAMLEQCHWRLPQIVVVHGSATQLPLASDSLGAVNCSDALQALPDPRAAILELARCMRSGASFTAFTFLEARQPYAYFQQKLHYAKRHLFTQSEIGDWLAEANLTLMNIQVIGQAIFFSAKK